ncbi:relaxase/mobilization nuclease domain-containing protein [Pontivivens ytuae]|uniref:Relaxase n=1 Tax=Pontivivens ytuae TaxID=2789856 RepID=A0A7S9LT46_9RHOB|nr:relaxase/mobilization nuclease domain-containing protein [Pontivivens ytuae]QPH54656.1 relaxase [Pontivivens ytuae]
MILKGNERGHGRELANHLMRGQENEHIELHDLRGFIADDLHGAMAESEAIAKGTRCKNHLFSLSLNPPPNETVPVETFEAAIDRIEEQLGLEGQPRAVVFHEKEGRRHAHAVWSRIDGEEMKAVQLSHYKRELNGIARDLYLEQGWEMPKGFQDHRQRDPLSYSRAEYQQARRTKQDPKEIKRILQESWAGSDSRQAFETALRDRGYVLARGDRRGYVAVDWRGEIYSLSRATGAKTRDLKARLGDAKALQSTEDAKAFIAGRMTPKLKAWAQEEQAKAEKQNLAAQFQREQMVHCHRQHRDQLRQKQEDRWQAEEQRRAERTPTGLRGLWGWITGKNRLIRQKNEGEIAHAQARDRAEKQVTIRRQLEERRKLQAQIVEARKRRNAQIQALNQGVAKYMQMGGTPPVDMPDRSRPERNRARGETGRRSHDQTGRTGRTPGTDHEPS